MCGMMEWNYETVDGAEEDEYPNMLCLLLDMNILQR